MMFTGKDMGYNTQTKQYIPKWQLDTAECIVYFFNEQTLEIEETCFHTGYARDHIYYVSANHPDRLQRKLDDGTIIDYITDVEERAMDAVDSQVELWKENDKDYLLAKAKGDIRKMAGLENGLINMAKELIYPAIINV